MKPRVVGSQISQRAYAKHRGVTLRAVQKAIKAGRLSHSLTENAQGHKKILSAEAADSEWLANTRQIPEPGIIVAEDAEDADADPVFMNFNEAHRRLEVEKWLRERTRRRGDDLDLAKREGELISVDEARETVIAEYSTLKTKLLGIPSRAAQRLPELDQEAIGVLEDLIREALEALSDGE